VLNNTVPDTPADPTPAVDSTTEPEPALVLDPLTSVNAPPVPRLPTAAPALKLINPPLDEPEVAVVPANSVSEPPAPDDPEPTVKLMDPPLPPVATPD